MLGRLHVCVGGGRVWGSMCGGSVCVSLCACVLVCACMHVRVSACVSLCVCVGVYMHGQ